MAETTARAGKQGKSRANTPDPDFDWREVTYFGVWHEVQLAS